MSLFERISRATSVNLKMVFMAAALLVVTLILSGQGILSEFYRQEHQQIQRLYHYDAQLKLVNDLMNDLAAAVRDDEEVDFILSRLMDHNRQLAKLNTILNTEPHQCINKEIEKLEARSSAFIDKLIQRVPVIAASVAGNLSEQAELARQYQSLLHEYDNFQNTHRLIDDILSASIAQRAAQYRTVFWVISIAVPLLFLLTGFFFYRWLSQLIERQMATLKQKNRLQQQMFEKQVEHEQRITAILETTVDAIITISEQGAIESFNHAAERMFGYAAKDVIGKNIKILMPEDIAEQHDGFLRHYCETGESRIIGTSVEVTAKRIDGSEVPVLLSVSEVKLPSGRLFTGIMHDLTQRKKEEQKLQQLTADLLEKQQLLEQEENIARHVFEHIITTNNVSLPEVAFWSEPLETFSGDLMLSAVLPNGGIRILLCDFTGHGLPAAMGAVPVSSIFHAMSLKGLPLDILMMELNCKLKSLLPTGMFCCISAVDIDATRRHAHIWNAGLPDVLLVNTQGQVKQRFSSRHLPLGVMEYSAEELLCEDILLASGDVIYLLTDGLTEVENEQGERLGQERLEQILACAVDDEGRLSVIQQQIRHFMGSASPTDDLSLIAIKTLVMDEVLTLES